MVKKLDSNAARLKRHKRVRAKISGTPERPRLNVFRSAKHIYAQIIDCLLYTSRRCTHNENCTRYHPEACYH